MNWTNEELQAIVDEHALVLFMKGTPNEPQCGFSNRAAQALQQFGEPFAAVVLGLISQPCLKSSFKENSLAVQILCLKCFKTVASKRCLMQVAVLKQHLCLLLVKEPR